MELRQLTYFEAVARLGGFGRAATELRIAQPSVSTQIRRLERELGAALFERTTRHVELTDAGAALLPRARAVLDELNAARADLGDLGAVLSGRLRLGVTAVLGSLDLPALLAGYHRRHPGVDLSVRTGLVAKLLSGLRAGRFDAVLGPVDDALPDAFAARVLSTETLVLVTGPDIAPTTTLRAVAGHPFACLPVGSGLRAILDAAGADAGFTPHVRFEAADPAGLRALVSAGLGVALLAVSAATAPGPPVRVHALDPPPPHPPIGVIWRAGHAPVPAARAWLEQLAVSR